MSHQRMVNGAIVSHQELVKAEEIGELEAAAEAEYLIIPKTAIKRFKADIDRHQSQFVRDDGRTRQERKRYRMTGSVEIDASGAMAVEIMRNLGRLFPPTKKG